MRLGKKFGLLLISSFAFVLLFAQNDKRTVGQEIYFDIKDTYKFHDTIIAFLNTPMNIGLKKGMLVKGYQSYKAAVPGTSKEKIFHEVGSGKMVWVDTLYSSGDTLTACFIKLSQPEDSMETGDVVSLNLEIPALPYRSVFSELVFQDIPVLNADRKALFRYKDFIASDSRKKEDSVYAAIIDDFHNAWTQLKDRNDLSKTYLEKASAGRFEGKSILDVLRDVKRKDLESFLLYLKAYVSSYRGSSYPFYESFAGWLSVNSPYSSIEIKQALLPVYKNKTEFEKLLPIYKADILSGRACMLLGDQAVSLASENYHEGLQLIDFAKTLAIAVKDTVSEAYVQLCNAQIYQDKGDYPEGVHEAGQAAALALMVGNKEDEITSLVMKAFCLYKMSGTVETKAALDFVEAKLEAYHAYISGNKYYESWERCYEYEGALKYNEGDYKQALEKYDKAIEFNNAINSYTTLIRNAELLKFVGRVYNDRGEPEKALESYTEAAKIYRDKADKYNEAIVENEIAYSYYNLGNYRNCMAYCEAAMAQLLETNDYDNAGHSKSLIGSCYWELGHYDSAVSAHKESIALRKKGNNLSGQAFSWKEIGELYLLSGLKTFALAAYDSAANLYQDTKDYSGLAETYNKKGTVYLNDENYKIAAEFFEKAKGINSKTSVESLFNLGSAWSEIDTSKASSYYAACQKKSDSTGNIGYVFAASKALAGLAYKSTNIKLGDELYQECVALSQQLNTPTSKAYCLRLKADKFSYQTQLDSALFYYNTAKEIFDTVSKDDVIWQLNSIASVQLSLGNFAEASAALTKAIEIAKSTSNNLALGFSLEASSFLYGLTGEFAQGIKNSDSAIAIFNRSGNMLRLANTYVSRGTLLKSMGEYRQSINSFLFADSIYKQQLTNEYRHTVLNNIGVTYYNQYDYQNALKYFDLALQELKKGVIDETYLLYRGNYAECQYYLKKYKEAEANYLDVFPAAKEKRLNRIASGMALGLGKLYYDTKRIPEAVQYFTYAKDYAFSSGEKEKMVESLTYLGRIDVQGGRTDSAEVNFRKAISVAAQFKTVGGWEPYYELGLTFYNQKKYDSSIRYFKQAVNLLDKNAENLYGGEEAKKTFNNDPRKSDLYNKITFAYYNTGNEKEAWAYANRSNIAGIKELSGSISTTATEKEKGDALKKLLSLQQSKKALETTAEKQTGEARQQTLKKIEILEADYTNFLQDVVQTYPDLGSYFAKSNADQFYNYKSKIPNDVAVALYLVNDKTLMIFTLTNEKLAIDTMTADISKTVSGFIAAAKQPQKGTGTGSLRLRSEPTDEDETAVNIPFKDLSSNLYDILISPVYDKIKTKKRLCIIPTGIFSNMPFQCLGQKLSDSSFHFLVEDFGIFYTNQMKIFDEGANLISKQTDLVSFAAFGVPDQTLHYNTREVKEIGKIMGIDSTIYADSRATESMAKFSLIHKKYIHFATHGVLNYSSQFSKSYLKFLPDKDTTTGNNGQLTIREIQSLPIEDCDLVTLSACETAITKELAKGWTISPANSFLERRVKSVVASLWKVDDEATSILMDEFYKNLNKKLDKVDALRLAQETLSKNPKYSHPFYWGAFVLYGEWR